MLLSLIVPVYNEEKNLSLFFERSRKVLESLLIPFEIIFINDGSKDESLALIKQFSKNNISIRFIDLSRNFGHQIAVSAGLDYAKGDIICIIDADLQDPPELIPVMLDKMKTGYEGITSFSNAPLKLVTYFGVIVSVFAFIATLFVLYSIYVIKSFVPGWGSLLISILFIGGVQMIAIGIIGEYLSRMNQNLLNRPLYVVREKN